MTTTTHLTILSRYETIMRYNTQKNRNADKNAIFKQTLKQKKKERVNPLYDESQCKKTTLSDCMGLCPLSDCEPCGFSDSHIFDPSALLCPCNHRNP